MWASANPVLVPVIRTAANILAKFGKREVALHILRQFLATSEGRQHQSVVELHDGMAGAETLLCSEPPD